MISKRRNLKKKLCKEGITMKLNIREHTSNSFKRDIMDLPTSERVDLMIDLWNDPKFTGGVSTERAMQYWENKGWDTSRYTQEEFNRIWDLATDEWDSRSGYVEEEEEDSVDGIETKEDAYRWLQSKVAEYGNTYHFPQEERIKLDRLIGKFGNTYFWRR